MFGAPHRTSPPAVHTATASSDQSPGQAGIGGARNAASRSPAGQHTELAPGADRWVLLDGDGAPGRYLCGASPKGADPDCDVDALEDVDHALFEEVIWPALYERVPAFESLRVESSWAGLYEFCTLDQNAVVGWHPDASNLVVAAGFSGHGLQHAPGVGRAVAELIDSGGYESIDLQCLDYGRVARNAPLFEANVW